VSTFNCPICKQERYRQSFYDDDLHMTVESWHECKPCGFRDGYSYGSTEMEIRGKIFGWYHGTSMKEQRKVWKRFRRIVRRARRAFNRGYRLTHNERGST